MTVNTSLLFQQFLIMTLLCHKKLTNPPQPNLIRGVADGHPIPIIQNITLSKHLSFSSELLRRSLVVLKAENTRVKTRLCADISVWRLPMHDANEHGECWGIIGDLPGRWNTKSLASPNSSRNTLFSCCHFLSKNVCHWLRWVGRQPFDLLLWNNPCPSACFWWNKTEAKLWIKTLATFGPI